MTLGALLGKISEFILNPIIILGFVIALIVFFWGIVQLIWKADSDTDRVQARKSVLYGIVGLFIMFSVYGILHFILATFGFGYPSFLP